jgi:hypothetical protein
MQDMLSQSMGNGQTAGPDAPELNRKVDAGAMPEIPSAVSLALQTAEKSVSDMLAELQ